MATSPLPADLARVHKRMDQFAKEIDGRAMSERMRRLAKQAGDDAEEAVRRTPARHGSLADQTMSNWRPGRPIRIRTRPTVRGTSDVSALITPDRSAGLWRVLESGRRAHVKGGIATHERKNRKGELRTVKRKSKRSGGATSGKGTWTAAVRLMAPRTDQRFKGEIAAAWRKAFGGS